MVRNCREWTRNGQENISLKKLLGNCWQLLFKKRVASPLAVQRLNCCDYLSADVRQMLYGFSSVSNLFSICGLFFPRRTRINTDFYSVYSVFSVDFFFTRKVTDGHGCPQADEEDIVYHRNLDGM